jgi:signal transduction histidine kinase/ActR/RegA family two-component response regulator
MGSQFYFLYAKGETQIGAFSDMRIVYHVGTVLTMYVFSRITVNRRNAENAQTQEWLNAITQNNHDMEDFLSNISHELRTPVNVVSGMTSVMKKNNDSGELSAIQDAGIRLAHQIEDIQDYTEIKRGELCLEEENYMCVSLINDVVANYKSLDKNKDLELIVDITPGTPSMLKGDIKKLHKLFRHLLENAIKFTRRGGIYIKVFSVPQDYGVNLTIEVTDTGIGMTRADMSRVSKGMYQANKKRDRSTGGIGIGLPIVYGTVHKMGGFVNINSKKGRGTTVRISLPQQVVDPTPCLSVGKEAGEGIVFYIKPEKYKVPEMREFSRDMAVNLAKGLGMRLYSAEDKRELEHLTGDLKISCIFTGQEEYVAETAMLDYMASQGYRIVVAADPGFKAAAGSGVTVLSKPMYAFPIVRVLNGELEAELGRENPEDRVMFTGVRALVVDDEPMNLVVASGLFRDYGMDIDTAESGMEAIKKYEDGDYDVIFMDHMMPEMDGVEAMKRIRAVADASYRKPVIIALTANALSGAREMFMKEGFDGFIAKPVDTGEFERVMNNVLPEEASRREGRADA